MPANQFITISPADLKAILDILTAANWSGGHITIIDLGDAYMIRDKEGCKISEFQKSENITT